MNMRWPVSYWPGYEKYTTDEARKIAAIAKEKKLILLEGNYMGCLCDPTQGSRDSRGYCVTQVVAGQYLVLSADGEFQNYSYHKGLTYEDLSPNLTLEEAKKLIENFDGTAENYPNFFAYIKVSDGEPEHYGYLQLLQLEQFAQENGIVYKEKFVCNGGPKTWWSQEDRTQCDNIIGCCEESFSQITANDFLVVSDMNRLGEGWYVWHQLFDIIPVGFREMGYIQYEYSSFERYQREEKKYKKQMKELADREYEEMCREHREMMFEQDQPCIDVEEEEYEEWDNQYD